MNPEPGGSKTYGSLIRNTAELEKNFRERKYSLIRNTVKGNFLTDGHFSEAYNNFMG
jgi:hypothetical protein